MQEVHLPVELVETAAVVDHKICPCEPFVAVYLSGDPCPRICFVESSVTHQPLYGELRVDVHHHESMEIPSARLDQKGHVEYHRFVGVAILVQSLGNSLGNCRMHDGIQSCELIRLGKDPTCKAGPVETPVCKQDLASERIDDCRQGRFAGHLQFPGDRVRVDHGVTQPGEVGTDTGFPAPDSACKADDSHAGDDATHRYVHARCRRIRS